jgi:hypothetical protein
MSRRHDASSARRSCPTQTCGSAISGDCEVSRAGSLVPQDVLGVHQPAQAEGEAAAPDAPGEPVAQSFQARDPQVEIIAPRGRELFPVAVRWRAAVWQKLQSGLDLAERDADCLRRADERHSAQHVPGVATLVPRCPSALDETLGVVEVQGRHAHAAAGRQLADRQLPGDTRRCNHVLDLNLS